MGLWVDGGAFRPQNKGGVFMRGLSFILVCVLWCLPVGAKQWSTRFKCTAQSVVEAGAEGNVIEYAHAISFLLKNKARKGDRLSIASNYRQIESSQSGQEFNAVRLKGAIKTRITQVSMSDVRVFPNLTEQVVVTARYKILKVKLNKGSAGSAQGDRAPQVSDFFEMKMTVRDSIRKGQYIHSVGLRLLRPDEDSVDDSNKVMSEFSNCTVSNEMV